MKKSHLPNVLAIDENQFHNLTAELDQVALAGATLQLEAELARFHSTKLDQFVNYFTSMDKFVLVCLVIIALSYSGLKENSMNLTNREIWSQKILPKNAIFGHFQPKLEVFRSKMDPI